jgi:hypothetical protein
MRSPSCLCVCVCPPPPQPSIEVVSVGTHLNFYYIIHSIFLFLLIAGGVLCQHMSISMFICYFPCNQTSWRAGVAQPV